VETDFIKRIFIISSTSHKDNTSDIYVTSLHPVDKK